MSQTMYAIKKVGDTHHNTNEQVSSNKQSSVTSAATSVWQKKKRKRDTKKHKNNNKTNESLDEEESSSITTNDDQQQPTFSPKEGAEKDYAQHNNLPATKDNQPLNESSSNYDPAQNPYSLENYQKNHELQKKVENNVNKAVHPNEMKLEEEPSPQREQAPLIINTATKSSTISTVDILISNKSPLSQVRLTPLFPTPPTAVLGNNGFNGFNGFNKMPSFPPNVMGGNAVIQRLNQKPLTQYLSSAQIQHQAHTHTHTHTNQQHQQHPQPQRQQAPHNHNDDPSQCPHGNLSAEELINIKIRKRNVCYVVGLPIHVATEQKLRTQEWFGQFGNIATIAINRNSKSIQANSIPAHITYDNDVSALNAINFCNKFIFDDGRKLKATFGTQHYCRWFIAANKKCTNVFCGFRHSWCRQEDIITQKDINDFKAIPAGAYTSRNIENQPLGVRSTTSNDTFKQTQSAHPSSNMNNNNANTVTYVTHLNNLNNNNTHNNAQSGIINNNERTSHITPHDGGVIGGDTSILSVTNKPTDPYTFYLSNSAATPTGPGQPQIAAVAPPVIPNIYDSRNVLMKQIMNRNHAQQLEIERLQQQIKILSEMEMKNKQEIHRWWTDLATTQQSEKNLKIKYEKMSKDYDNLQIKYLALDDKYKHLLETKNAAKKKEFESWNADDVVKWIMSLDNDKFKKYEQVVGTNIAEENIDGPCLESLDKGDLHRLGVTDFKHKKDLLKRIKELVTPTNSDL